jgi:valacyclovir hydrolase
MPFADLTTNARLYYDETGSGAPYLLLHGFLGTGRLHLGPVMDWLTAEYGYHCIAPTMRGYGQSTPKPRDFPPDFYKRDALDMLAFMDALSIPKAHLLGYSDGGETALMAAGLQPERFRSVAVIGAVGYFSPEVRPAGQRMYPPTWMTAEQKALHGITNPDQFVLRWIKAFHAMIDSGGDVSLHLAHNITCPLLIMLGDQDTLNPPDCAQKFIAQTPNGRLQMFRCGHAVQDQDWPGFQKTMRAFLKL